MKIHLKFLMLLLFSYSYGQNANPSIGSTINFEGDPVNLFTGIPDISIPLYSMPTRSKDININFSLSYHPSGASLFYQRMGNCGSGWNLFAGGVISKVESEGRLLYSFNFMGYSGKFGVEFYPEGGSKYVLFSSDGPTFVITAEKDSQGRVTIFDIFDDRGLKFRFGKRDTTYSYKDGVWIAQDSAFQLTEIYDTNNNLLATFNYNLESESINIGTDYIPVNASNKINILTSVIIEGYGRVDLTYNPYYPNGSKGLWIGYQTMTIRNSLNETIKTVEFYQSTYFDTDQRQRFILNEVAEYGINNSDPLRYKFFYKPLPVSFPTPFEGVSDEYGYYNFSDKYCTYYQYPDPENINAGILEKMMLPTGGCVIYEYEGNTYSYRHDTFQYDLTLNGQVDDNFYYNFNEAKNFHNYRKDFLGSSFTLNSPTRVYFKFNGNVQQVDLNSPGSSGGTEENFAYFYPGFELYNLTTNEQKAVFEHEKPESNHWRNCNNRGLGAYEDLPNGSYVLRQYGNYGFPLYSMAYTLIPKEEPGRFWYGPGIRIKRIACFTQDMRQDYFRTDLHLLPPAKLVTYKYNVFGDPKQHSSGYLSINSETDGEVVRYRNVSVIEGIGNGRTDFTFISPWDTDITTEAYDYKHGKLKSKKIYSESNANDPQVESNYNYKLISETNVGSSTFPKQVGWFLPEEVINIERYPSGTIKTTDKFTYYPKTNKLKQKISTSSRSSQTVTTNNYYKDASAVSTHGKNLILPDYSESLLGTRLMSTSKVEYLNTWTNNGYTNISHLPSEVKQSKGTGSLEVKSKINRCDRFGHVLETENPGGVKTSYIYGYNTTQIIAEIVNASYNDIPQSWIDDIQIISDSGNESDLINKLNDLRSLSQLADSQITTYTYKPLIGISTMTDIKGYRISYEYDSNNRQTIVKDQQGNIVTEKRYYTKPQN